LLCQMMVDTEPPKQRPRGRPPKGFGTWDEVDGVFRNDVGEAHDPAAPAAPKSPKAPKAVKEPKSTVEKKKKAEAADDGSGAKRPRGRSPKGYPNWDAEAGVFRNEAGEAQEPKQASPPHAA